MDQLEAIKVSEAEHVVQEKSEPAIEKSIEIPEHKSPSAFRTIGEVAADLSLPPHVLRFWETKFPQIKPHKRRGGHRYYRPQDVDLLTEIKSLLHTKGFTIKGAQKFLSGSRRKTVDSQVAMFVEQDEISHVSSKKLNKIFNELCEIKDLLNQF